MHSRTIHTTCKPIQTRHPRSLQVAFLKKKTLLVDLGSSPGGWSQVVEKEISNGKIWHIYFNRAMNYFKKYSMDIETI